MGAPAKSLLVKDVMTRDVVVFSPQNTLDFALKAFAKKGVSGAPVVSGERLVGMVTEYDVIKVMDIHAAKSKLASIPHFLAIMAGTKNEEASERLRRSAKDAGSMMIEDFMTKDPVSVGKDTTMLDAARLIDVHKVNRLPVTEKGKLLGIITRSDIIRAVAGMDAQLSAGANAQSKKGKPKRAKKAK
jgi:CBS domain-containing protein